MIRDLPFVTINIDEHPDRRADMMKLASQFSVPQVFFNSKHIGGAVRLTLESLPYPLRTEN